MEHWVQSDREAHRAKVRQYIPGAVRPHAPTQPGVQQYIPGSGTGYGFVNHPAAFDDVPAPNSNTQNLEEWMASYRVRQEKLNFQTAVMYDAADYMQEQAEAGELRRERTRRVDSQGTVALWMTLVLFLGGCLALALFSNRSEYALYNYLVHRISVEQQLALGEGQLTADGNLAAPEKGEQQLRVSVELPTDAGQDRALMNNRRRSGAALDGSAGGGQNAGTSWDISGRLHQDYPINRAGSMPVNGSIYDDGMGLVSALWRVENHVGDLREPAETLVMHANPSLQMLPNGDMLCVWFVNKGKYFTDTGGKTPGLSADKGWASRFLREHLREHPFDQNTWTVPENQLIWKEYNLDNYTEFLRAQNATAHGNMVPPPPHLPPPPPPMPHPPLSPDGTDPRAAVQERTFDTLLVMMSRLRKGQQSWEEPYGIWEAPAIPPIPSDGHNGGFMKEMRGVATDTSTGILVQPVPEDVFHPPPLPTWEKNMAKGESELEKWLMVEKKLKEQELAYHDHNRPMEVTLITSAVSKHVTELKVHASYLPVNHHQQIETVQTWALPLSLGASRQASKQLAPPFLLLPDTGMHLRHHMVQSTERQEWLLPVHYMPSGSYDTHTHRSGVRYFRVTKERTGVDLSSRGFGEISKIGEELVEPLVMWVPSATTGLKLVAFLRSRGSNPIRRYIFRSESSDNGRTWSTPTATRLPCYDRAFDAVALPNGNIALIFVNSLRADRWGPISVALSNDRGYTWPWIRDLDSNYYEKASYSDPTITRGDNGQLRVAYVLKGMYVRYAAFFEDWIKGTWHGAGTRGDYPRLTD